MSRNEWLPQGALLLVVAVLAFGLLIPFLGLYWDDWPVIFMAKAYGTQMYQEFYTWDRPFSAWTYILTIPVLGVTPWRWHVFTLLARWGTALAAYAALRGLWPQRKALASWSSLLFLVYPAFFKQPIAVAFNQHFLTYLFFMSSLALMIWTQRRPERFWPFTIAALLLSPLHMLIMEYFIGLALVRPVALWLVFDSEPGWRARLRRTVVAWAPYLAIVLAFAIWRMFFLQFPVDDPNPTRLLADLREAPVAAVLGLAETAARDVAQVLLMTWYQLIDPALFDVSDRFVLISVALSVLAAGGLAVWGYRRKMHDEDVGLAPLYFGLIALLVGFAPVWVVGRNVFSGFYGDRYALPAMFGAAIALVALIQWLVRTRAQQVVLLSLLVALPIGQHLRVANDYRWDWTEQKRYYAQVLARAPGLAPHTAVVTGGSISAFVDGYVGALALNAVYGVQPAGGEVPYWLFNIYQGPTSDFEGYLAGRVMRDNIRNLSFEGHSSQTVMFFNSQDEGGCLWMLTPADQDNLQLAEQMRTAATVVDLGAVQADAAAAWDEALFGAHPADSWCLTFQRASLAAQQNDWPAVLDAYAHAVDNGQASSMGYEYIPFIRAFAETGDWETAAFLTRDAYKKSFRAQSMLCALWADYAERGIAPQDAYDDVLAGVGCNDG